MNNEDKKSNLAWKVLLAIIALALALVALDSFYVNYIL